jgi:outer membrane protein assembly factor BamB
MELEGVQQVIMTSASSTVGLDIDSGERLWAYTGWQPGNPIPPSVYCGQGRFFLTEGYKGGSAMFKVTKQDGKFQVNELWKTQACGAQIHRPFFMGDYLYALSNSNDRNQGLMCLDMDGKVKWQTDKSPSFERGCPVYADGVLYVMEGNSGILRVVQPSPDGYKELAQTKLLAGKEIWAPMAISNGKLFCRDQQKLLCVDLKAPE